jgi:hypothetical protein
MLTPSFKNALRKIAKIINAHNIQWAVIGSANMALQGMNVRPKDLDIIVNKNDLNIIKNIFAEYIKGGIQELTSTANIPVWELELNVDGVEVQILGEEDKGQYASNLVSGNIIDVELDGAKISCLTLRAEADAYTETNRPKKANMIRNYLLQGNKA